ncbi:MAG: hypothetical protein V4581_16695 [Bacteroidota bacterium]
MPDPTILDRLLAQVPKIDSPDRLAQFAAFGREYYADAEYLNAMREAIIAAFEALNIEDYILKEVETLDDITFPATRGFFEVLNDTNFSAEPQRQLYYSNGLATEPGELYTFPFARLNTLI